MTERVSIRNGELVWSKDWTAAELAEAARLRRDRKSATAIGLKLGRSRNSVIGALHRAKVPGVLQNNAAAAGTGRWSRLDKPARRIPLRLSGLANG